METTTETSVFKVSGISCQGCAATIKKVLGPIPGVSAVSVDVAAKTVSVTRDEHVHDDAIAQVLEHAGYPASKAEGESSCCGGGQTVSCCSAPVQISARGEKDPVCGMDVDPKTARWSHDFEGSTYHFCSKGCLAKFRADPHAYFGKGEVRQAHDEPLPWGALYTCPMHPEIVQEGPGSCPKCGMALSNPCCRARTRDRTSSLSTWAGGSG